MNENKVTRFKMTLLRDHIHVANFMLKIVSHDRQASK